MLIYKVHTLILKIDNYYFFNFLIKREVTIIDINEIKNAVNLGVTILLKTG